MALFEGLQIPFALGCERGAGHDQRPLLLRFGDEVVLLRPGLGIQPTPHREYQSDRHKKREVHL